MNPPRGAAAALPAHVIDFEDRFKRRVHLVDKAPGFIRNEVHRPRPMKFDHTQGGFVPDPTKEGYYEVNMPKVARAIEQRHANRGRLVQCLDFTRPLAR